MAINDEIDWDISDNGPVGYIEFKQDGRFHHFSDKGKYMSCVHGRMHDDKHARESHYNFAAMRVEPNGTFAVKFGCQHHDWSVWESLFTRPEKHLIVNDRYRVGGHYRVLAAHPKSRGPARAFAAHLSRIGPLEMARTIRVAIEAMFLAGLFHSPTSKATRAHVWSRAYPDVGREFPIFQWLRELHDREQGRRPAKRGRGRKGAAS